MIIRNALINDLASIVKIYNDTISSRLVTADIEPVSIESKIDWFYSHSPNKRPIWVAEVRNEIAGWLSLTDFLNRRPAYDGTAEISIYISAHHRRRGIGSTLLTMALEQAEFLDIKVLIGYIFAHNKPSLSIFSKFGFVQWGYLPKVAVLDNISRDLVIKGRRT